MKKTMYLVISFLLLMNYTKAQKASFGFTAGTTISSYKIKAESLTISPKSKVGFTTGVVSSINFGKNFSFQPGLHFVQKGGKMKNEQATNQLTLNYVELPLNMLYNIHQPKGKFFVGAGPSLSMGISGKEKLKDGSNSLSEKIKFGNKEDDDLKAIEVGINFLAGYQCKNGLLIAANYNTGLNNLVIAPANTDTKYHNNYFGIRMGYMFGSIKN